MNKNETYYYKDEKKSKTEISSDQSYSFLTNDMEHQGQHFSAPPLRPVEHLLRENGVEDWHPRVPYQLLVFQYNATKQFLNTVKAVSAHRHGVGLIDKDINLALALEEENQVFKLPDDKTVKSANRTPLPRVSSNRIKLIPGAFIQDPVMELQMRKLSTDRVVAGKNDVADDHEDTNMTPSFILDTVAGAYNVKKSTKEVTVNIGTAIP